MRGFMRQRGEAWELRAYIGRDPVSGRKRWATKTVHGGKREAERALAALVAEADKGTLARTGVTVGELLERWLDHAKADFSPTTERETRSIINRSLVPALGEVPLHRLGVADIDRFYRQQRKCGGRDGRPLARRRSAACT